MGLTTTCRKVMRSSSSYAQQDARVEWDVPLMEEVGQVLSNLGSVESSGGCLFGAHLGRL
eukprot:821626-Amphidinium_carterae.2